MIVETEERTSVFFREDGLVEYATAFLFLVAMGLLLVAARRGESGRNHRIFLALIGIAFFVIAMEEISWGQRILGWETGGWFGETNAQDETNLHNANTELTHWAFWGGTILIGVLIPYVHKTVEPLRKLLDRIEFPVMSPDFTLFFLLPFVFSATSPANPVHKTEQVIELAALCIIPGAILHLRFSRPFVQALPPVWGRYLPLLLPAVGIPLFVVHELFLKQFRNPALEMREMLIAFGFAMFAYCELKKSSQSGPGKRS